MASVVFILGAGASHGAGAPLMHNFLETAENLHRTGKVKKYSADFERVFDAIGKLQRVHSKSKLDLSNIEVIFNTLEMAKIIGKFPDGDKNYIDKTIKSLRILISVTLEQSIRFTLCRGAPNNIVPTIEYMAFTHRVKYLLEESKPKQTVAILTFNYDIALDFALGYEEIETNYFLDEAKYFINTLTYSTYEENKGGIPLLKLHGSVNWGQCLKCKKIIPIPFSKKHEEYRETMSFRDYFDEHQHCKGRNLSTEPFIIPPTWNKTDAHKEISNVWQQAAKELSEAEYIFISGYSMPETDMFFRLLFALGTEGSKILKKITVFNSIHSANTEEEKRFRDILGQSAEGVFDYSSSGFREMSALLESMFPK